MDPWVAIDRAGRDGSDQVARADSGRRGEGSSGCREAIVKRGGESEEMVTVGGIEARVGAKVGDSSREVVGEGWAEGVRRAGVGVGGGGGEKSVESVGRGRGEEGSSEERAEMGVGGGGEVGEEGGGLVRDGPGLGEAVESGAEGVEERGEASVGSEEAVGEVAADEGADGVEGLFLKVEVAGGEGVEERREDGRGGALKVGVVLDRCPDGGRRGGARAAREVGLDET
mmetsp:Transcript_9384/g.29957  ORF Transcript_9384/g.29957 Transcript_9384/m.29957 type:complete len:228 (+) Transcript_9384:189-872(+)